MRSLVGWSFVSLVFLPLAGLLGCSNNPPPEQPPIGDGPPTGSPWSDPNSWPSGKVPVDGDNVVIEADMRILLDVSTADLASLTIDGTLVFAETDLELRSGWVALHGTLGVGGPGRPFPADATLTLTSDDLDEDTMGMGTRGLLVMGGVLELHGSPPNPTWTKLGANAEAGADTLTLMEEVDWQDDDTIVVAPTNYYGTSHTERVRLNSASGSALELAEPLTAAHWGVLQYVSDGGMTLDSTSEITPLALDERAEVGNLTRNIVIQAPDDDAWQEHGFGVHVMVMSGGTARVNGVEIRRGGQAGRLARYPFHWHLMSYSSNGEELEDLEDQYVRNSSIWGSAQRCIVVHSTNGAVIENNVCHDIKGHAIFLEDAVERRTVVEGNLVLGVHAVDPDDLLLHHEQAGFRGGPSGFWITNPDNVLRGNAVADATVGFWYALPAQSIGLSKNVDIAPTFLPFGVFEDNVAHSNMTAGLIFDRAPIDDEGNVGDLGYRPREGGREEGAPVPFTMSRTTIYKHAEEGLWDRFSGGAFEEFVVADFGGKGFAGSSTCTIANGMMIGTSLNEGEGARLPAVGTASYHSSCWIRDNVMVNLPAVPQSVSGAFAADDYYITGVDLGLYYNSGNRLINTHPGYRSPSPNTIPKGEGLEHWSLAGALWDPHGFWGPKGNYWVLDLPFLTAGTTCQDVRDSVHGNDKTCAGPYFGVSGTMLSRDENPYTSTRPIRFVREDSGLTGDDAIWFIDDGACTDFLGNMRNTAVLQGGEYRIEHPGGQQPADSRNGGDAQCGGLEPPSPPPSDISIRLTNFQEPDDWVMLGLPYDGSVAPTDAYITTRQNFDEILGTEDWACYKTNCGDWESDTFIPLNKVGSRDLVRSGECADYYQDTAANLIWVKVCRGHMPHEEGELQPNAERPLYQPLALVVYAE